MISVIVYGRNDSYGYNLNKRAALSLNCIAHLLSDPDDEILFVDYNTPDDFPTFPEAIRDTLSAHARSILRILRVRPKLHEQYKTRTHLPVLEGVSRNIAVRRSNPSNRWILSTNTDMIFVPSSARSLNDICGDVIEGYFHTPRFDLPESIWENLDRLDADGSIKACKHFGRALHINEIVRSQAFFLYDAPGDFQLILRKDLFEFFGFCEDMLLGWHLDANMSKRLHLKYRKVGDLATTLSAYHCNHMRQATPKHVGTKTDDWTAYVETVNSSQIASQAENWGHPGLPIEEISLSSCPSDIYRSQLQRLVKPQHEPTSILYTHESFDQVGYEAEHVIPYLADIFVNCPRDWSIGWFGQKRDLLRLFDSLWRRLGFEGHILIESNSAEADFNLRAVSGHSTNSIVNTADAFIFDFGHITGMGSFSRAPEKIKKDAEQTMRSFWYLINFEERAARKRRIITINAMNSYIENIIRNNFCAVRTRISTRLRYGVAVKEPMIKDQWLTDMRVGPAGMRDAETIRARDKISGHVAYGPYKALRPGDYVIRMVIRLDHPSPIINDSPPLILEVANCEEIYVTKPFSWSDLEVPEHAVTFKILNPCATSVEARLWTDGNAKITLSSVVVERLLDWQSDSKSLS